MRTRLETVGAATPAAVRIAAAAAMATATVAAAAATMHGARITWRRQATCCTDGRAKCQRLLAPLVAAATTAAGAGAAVTAIAPASDAASRANGLDAR